MLKVGEYIKSLYNYIWAQWHPCGPEHHGPRRIAWLAFLAVMPATAAVQYVSWRGIDGRGHCILERGKYLL